MNKMSVLPAEGRNSVHGLCLFCFNSYYKEVFKNTKSKIHTRNSFLLKNRRCMKFLLSKLGIEEPKPYGFAFVSETVPLCPSCLIAFNQLHALYLKLEAIQLQIEIHVEDIRKTVSSSGADNAEVPTVFIESHFNLFRRLVKAKAKANGGGCKIPEVQIKLTRLAENDIPVRPVPTSTATEDDDLTYEDDNETPIKTEFEYDIDECEEVEFCVPFDIIETGNPVHIENPSDNCAETTESFFMLVTDASTFTQQSLPQSLGAVGKDVIYFKEEIAIGSASVQNEMITSNVEQVVDQDNCDASSEPPYQPPLENSSDFEEGVEDHSIPSTSRVEQIPTSSQINLEEAVQVTSEIEISTTIEIVQQGSESDVISSMIIVAPDIKPPPPRKERRQRKPKDADDCLLCDKKNKSEAELISHFKNDHPGQLPPQLKCPHCTHFACSRPMLRRHISKRHVSHEELEIYRRFGCSLCDKKYFDRKGLNTHFKTHTGEKSFACDQCGKAFRHKVNMEVHVRSVHQKIKRFQCPLCPKKFGNKGNLEYHVGVHQGEKKFGCHICGTRRSSLKSLENHFENHHKKIMKDWVEPPVKPEKAPFRRWRIRNESSVLTVKSVGSESKL